MTKQYTNLASGYFISAVFDEFGDDVDGRNGGTNNAVAKNSLFPLVSYILEW